MGLKPVNPFKRSWETLFLRAHVVGMLNSVKTFGESANTTIRRIMGANPEDQKNFSRAHALRDGARGMSILVSRDTFNKLTDFKYKYRWPLWKVVEQILEGKIKAKKGK